MLNRPFGTPARTPCTGCGRDIPFSFIRNKKGLCRKCRRKEARNKRITEWNKVKPKSRFKKTKKDQERILERKNRNEAVL